jgi:hypothetical protein
VWAEPDARRFTVFVFVSMLAYSAQDLILEPFAGCRVRLSRRASRRSLSGLQHGGGTLAGMLLAALAGRRWRASASALRSLDDRRLPGVVVALAGLAWPAGLDRTGLAAPADVFVLGVANGAFSIAAIASMMRWPPRAGAREGVRMGLWGAAQAIAFGSAAVAGTAASDLSRAGVRLAGAAYASVFALEAALFVLSALLAARIACPGRAPAADAVQRSGPGCPLAQEGMKGLHSDREDFDVVVVGGGPSGATAAHELAQRGRSVLLLDRDGPHQALRRRDPAAPDRATSRSPTQLVAPCHLRAHDLAGRREGRHPDRRRLRRHGRSRHLRRMAARACGGRGAQRAPDASSASSATPTAPRWSTTAARGRRATDNGQHRVRARAA